MDITLSSITGATLAIASLGFLFLRVVLEVRHALKVVQHDAAGATTWQR